jgi:ribosome biogenesis GTPase
VKQTGHVIKTTGSWHTVRTEGGEDFLCKVKGKFRIKGIRTTNPVAVGDIVDIQSADDEGIGSIVKIHPRRNYIIRKAINLSRESHIIGANLDHAWLIATLRNPSTFSMFIDRYLVTASAYQIPASLIFNKWDIYTKEERKKFEDWKSIYEKVGYRCIITSAETGFGIDELREATRDKLNVFSGNSGVGKSSLINKLDSSLDQRTDAISDSHHTGKHTTTYSEMLSIKGGGRIIDTPGISGFGTVDIEKNELYHFFPEIFKYSSSCQFHNCTHYHEPGCGVQEAVKRGDISPMRYGNYVAMYEDEPGKYRQTPW